MRKSMILMLIATLLVGAILVSCNSDAAGNTSSGNKLAKVVVTGNNDNSKGITAQSDIVDQASYHWYYKANKADNSVYRSGDTGNNWVAINGTSGGLVGADLGWFSEGTWDFSFRGYVSDNPNHSTDDPAYTAFLDDALVNNSTATSDVVGISVTLQHLESDLNAKVIFGTSTNEGLNWLYLANEVDKEANNTGIYATTSTWLNNNKTAVMKVYRHAAVSEPSTVSTDWTLFAETSAVLIANEGATFTTFKDPSSDSTEIRIPSSVGGTDYSFKFEVIIADEVVGVEYINSVKAYKGGTITVERSGNYAVKDNEQLYTVVVNQAQ